MPIISHEEHNRRFVLNQAADILTAGDQEHQAEMLRILFNAVCNRLDSDALMDFFELARADLTARILSPKTPEEYLALMPEERPTIERMIDQVQAALEPYNARVSQHSH